MEPKGSPSFTT